MKTYTCVCGQLLFFQNVACVNCRRELGFLPDLLWLSSLDPGQNQSDGSLLRPTAAEAAGKLYRKCQNYSSAQVCNWMVAQDESESFCVSCRLNEVIPDLSIPPNRDLWALIEGAKRRLVYSLLRLRLPVANKQADPERGTAFRFMGDQTSADGKITKVLTGHDQGTITLNIAEADDSVRERMRHSMNEPYRTLLGHFRHEIGHYYWDRLVRDTKFLPAYRKLFGDESADYGEALKKYYETGAPANWQENYISAYATSHPWEDWAESWAHFLHIHDTLEVANDFGLVGKRILLNPQAKRSKKSWLASKQVDFQAVIGAWSKLAVALNAINRSMGLPDLYPFVLSPAVIAKLRFIYDVVGGAEKQAAAA